MIRLETPRLMLRTFAAADAEAQFALDHDPTVMKFLGPYALDSVEAYRQRIESDYVSYDARADGLGLWALVEKSSQEFIGWVCLRPALDYRFAAEAGFRDGEAELGYRLFFRVWNRGYATEASRGLIDDVFQHQQTPTIVATTLETNLASRRVMEKCGLKFAGRFPLPGFETPAVKYALMKDEYLADR